MVSPPEEIQPQLEDLKQKGRGIYFYHDKNSKYPVRDITGRGKKEPYIEYGHDRNMNEEYNVGAENYFDTCYQKAVEELVTSDEEYLFLLSNPSHLDMERCIVGYIRKEDFEIRGEEHVSVIGETRLYSFDDAIPASEYNKRTNAPLGKHGEVFNEAETKEILNHFHNCDDVTEQVLEEVLRLKEDTNDGQSSGC